MTDVNVYLAGPIAGCTLGEANDWRNEVIPRLAEFGVIGISPLRCEPIIGERYTLNYQDPKFGTARAIASKNKMDVQRCDALLAYLPTELVARRPSYGTMIEMAWASWAGRPVLLVTDDPYLQQHPVVDACVNWFLDDLADGIETLRGLLAIYAQNSQAMQNLRFEQSFENWFGERKSEPRPSVPPLPEKGVV